VEINRSVKIKSVMENDFDKVDERLVYFLHILHTFYEVNVLNYYIE